MPASIRASPDLPVPRRWGDQRQRNLPTQLLKLGNAASAEERLAALEEAVARIGLDVYQPDPQVMTPEEEHRAKLADGINYVGEAALSLQAGQSICSANLTVNSTSFTAIPGMGFSVVCPVPSKIMIVSHLQVKCTLRGGTAGLFVARVVNTVTNAFSSPQNLPTAADDIFHHSITLVESLRPRVAYSYVFEARTLNVANTYQVQNAGGNSSTRASWIIIPDFVKQ